MNKRYKNKLTITNKFGFALMVLSIAEGIAIYLTTANTVEAFYVLPVFLIGAILYEKK